MDLVLAQLDYLLGLIYLMRWVTMEPMITDTSLTA